MPMYMTRYPLPRGSDAVTSCYATDIHHLKETIALRGMREEHVAGQTPNVPRMASELLHARRFGDANHALVWTSMVATRAGIATAWELLNDYGLLHQMAHVVESAPSCSCPSCQGTGLIDQLEAFERRVPGLHPSWGGELTERERSMAPLRLAERAMVNFTVSLDGAGQATKAAMDAIFAAIPAEPAKPIADPKRRGFDQQQIMQGFNARAEQRKRGLEALRARDADAPYLATTTTTANEVVVELGPGKPYLTANEVRAELGLGDFDFLDALRNAIKPSLSYQFTSELFSARKLLRPGFLSDFTA